MLKTYYDPATFKPRDYWWVAYDENTYCGCGECRHPVGYGETEAEAIADYNEWVKS